MHISASHGREMDTCDAHGRNGRRVCAMLLHTCVIISLTLGVLVSQGQASDADSTAVALAVVNGDTVYTTDLDRLLISTHRSMEGRDRVDFDYERLLTRLVNDRLIVQEALALGIDQDEYLNEELEEQRVLRATRLWVSDNFERDLTIPEDSVLTYFREHFRRVQMRLIASVDSVELERARASIVQGAAMDSIAQDISIDNYKTVGGLRSPTWHVEVEPVLRELADTSSVGELSAVFPYRSVFALARLENMIPADTAELAMVRPQIESWLKQRANTEQWQAFLEPLRAQYPLSIDSTVYDRIRADSGSLFTQAFAFGTQDTVLRLGETMAVTEADFRSRLAHNAMSAPNAAFNPLMEQTLKQLIERNMLTTAARADGYLDHPQVLAALQLSLDSALVDIYLAETVKPRIVFSRAEFEEYIKEHPEEFRRADRVRLDQMIVDSQAVAMEIYERLQDGADFSYIGREYDAEMPSTAETAEYLEVTMLPENVQAEVDSLQIGQCTRPHPTANGWLILRLMARKDGIPLPESEAENRIQTIMFQKKFNEELDSVLAVLKANSTIEYNEKAIKEYFGSGS